jgi:NTE family protein
LYMKKINFYLSVFIISLMSVLSAQEYGLVLSGGGGKGAYEVGVWKALCEYGIGQKVTEFSGTSVGGLNAALFASAPPEYSEKIWKELVPKMLTDQNGSLSEQLISQKGLKQIIEMVPLQDIKNRIWPRVTVTALKNRMKILKLIMKKKPGSNASRFVLNNENSVQEIQNDLLATAAFPVVCSPVLLKDGFEYTDGGEENAGGDNTPIAPVVQNSAVHTIFVVYLNDESRLERRVRQIDYPSVRLIEIIPTIDLGSMMEGTVNFSEPRINQLIERGYEDAVDVLRKKGFYPVTSYWFR